MKVNPKKGETNQNLQSVWNHKLKERPKADEKGTQQGRWEKRLLPCYKQGNPNHQPMMKEFQIKKEGTIWDRIALSIKCLGIQEGQKPQTMSEAIKISLIQSWQRAVIWESREWADRNPRLLKIVKVGPAKIR